MSRYFNTKTTLVIVSLLVVVCIFALFYRSCTPRRVLVAHVTPTDIQFGQTISYSDSTAGADVWLWEFGNGDSSDKASGQYVYPQTGKYQIRLTVNNRMEKRFIVNVQPQSEETGLQLVEINAPQTAMQGEYIVFRGIGNDKEWRWEFGETGIVDARDKNTIYAYEQPGIYEVLLSTESTRYPVRHAIEILPIYNDSDSTDVLTLIGFDIREKLQNVAEGKPFNSNYNYILTKYLNNNPNTPVIINNTKYNDFYSYCQGLRHSGRGVTDIENVIVETEDEQSSYINKMTVIQIEKEKK